MTCAAVERGASGAMMVGMGGVLKGADSVVLVAMPVVMQETCGEHGSTPTRLSWSAPDRLDQGTDVRGLSNKGYLH